MKKWSKLVLALAAGTMMFSGCIENIEPEGINTLRGAKADLLKAQTALQEAQAAKVNAEAALLLAEAKVQEALAKQEEAKVKLIEAQALKAQYEAEKVQLENEGVSIDNAEKQAKLDKLIAENEAAIAAAQEQAKLTAAQLERDLLEVQVQIAQNQAKYEVAMKNLTLAKVDLTAEQKLYLKPYETAFDNAKKEVDDLNEELAGQAKELAHVTAELDEAKANALVTRYVEWDLLVAKAELEAAKEAEAEAKALLELDKDLVAWDAKRVELDEKKAALEKEREAKLLESIERAQVWRDSLNLLSEEAGEYTAYTGYTWDYDADDATGTGLFSIIPGEPTKGIDIPEVYVPYPEGWPTSDVTGFSLTDSYLYGGEKDVLDEFDAEIMRMNMAETYYLPYFKRLVELERESVAAFVEDEGYVAAIENYEAMVAAYKANDYLAYANEYIYTEERGFKEGVVETVLAEYNDALKAFNDALAAYQTALEGATQDEKKLEQLDADKEAEELAAISAKMKAYQAAETAYATAEQAYVKAQWVHNAAVLARNNAVIAAVETAGFDTGSYDANAANDGVYQLVDVTSVVEQMTTANTAYTTQYPAGTTLPKEGEEGYDEYIDAKDQFTKYSAAISAINDADLKYNDGKADTDTDPFSAWDKADKAYGTAEMAYETALANADKAYNTTVDDIELKYAEAKANYIASLPTVNDSYKSYLSDGLDAAIDELSDAMYGFSSLLYPVHDVLKEDIDYTSVVYEGAGVDITIDVPNFLVADDKIVAATTETLTACIDPSLVKISIETFLVNNIFSEGEMGAMICNDWPLSYPTYEDYKKAKEMASTGTTYSSEFTYVNEYYDALMQIETAEEVISSFDSEALAAYVAAIEAAKKDFEAFVAEKEAEIEALKVDVEAHAPGLIAELENVEAENDAYEAKYDLLNEQIVAVCNIIDDYCTVAGRENEFWGHTVEAFVAALEELYDDAVEEMYKAETSVLELEKKLADIYNDKIDAVQFAQNDYDDIAAKLKEAQEELAEAAAELQKALERIGEAEAEEATPAA